MEAKMMRKIVILILATGFSSLLLRGQQEDTGIRESVEMIMALNDSYDPETLFESLADLKESPVDINSGDEKEIARLFFLTEFQVRILAEHVRKNGRLLSIYELSILPAFDRNTAAMMEPFVVLNTRHDGQHRGDGHSTILYTVASHFNPGDTATGIRSAVKMKHEGDRLSFGMTGENDPGERFLIKKGPDFTSGYILYQSGRSMNSILLGDFTLRIGEGLIYNSCSWMGSWLTSPSFMTGRHSADPYRSVGENNFLRGVAINLGNLNSGFMIFYSSNRVDARPVYDPYSVIIGVSNLVKGGIHVSRSQADACNRLAENIAGFHFATGAERVRGGITASFTWLSPPFLPDTTKPENLFAFTGNRLLNMGADFRAGTGMVVLFGEAAMSTPGSWAATAGMRVKPSPLITLNLLGRHLSPGYYAFHSASFTEGQGPGNESGIALSLHVEAASHLHITAAADHYLIPWPRYRSSSPSSGFRTELKGDYQPSENMAIRLTYSAMSRDYDIPAERGSAGTETFTRRHVSLLFDYHTASGLNLTTRVSASANSRPGERGYLLCQNISYSFTSFPLRLWYGYGVSSGSGYDCRLYSYENDLLSSFSMAVYYGEMVRSFVMVSLRPSGDTEFRMKYAFNMSGEPGSRLLRHELKIQARITF